MRLVYLDEARRDAAWWRIYYRRAFPEGKGSAYRSLVAVEKVLQENPLIGVAVQDLGVRKLSIPRTPFAFIYRLRHDKIEIVRLFDMRQKGSQQFQEDES